MPLNIVLPAYDLIEDTCRLISYYLRMTYLMSRFHTDTLIRVLYENKSCPG